MKKDLQIPFFLPLWRHIAVTGLCLGWAILELVNGAMPWAFLFGAIGFYLFWVFFATFDPADFRDKDEK